MDSVPFIDGADDPVGAIIPDSCCC
jgi:hypothetical protein